MLCPLTLEREFPVPQNGVKKDRLMAIDFTGHADGELALAWRRGDANALRALVDRHRSAAFGLALRLCGNRDRAEDLAQEAFLRAISRLHQYDAGAPFRPWLFRILGRLFIDQLRRQREFTAEDPLDPPPSPSSLDGDLFVQALLETLPPHQRAILVLREVAELSYEDLAQYFAIPVGTVRSRLAHARLVFKERYLQMSGEVTR
ncbi:MAG: RNA polymerase sigma factor [Armatimonadota bacterium]